MTELLTPLNIVELIESNPITRLTNNYHNKLILKIKDNFTDIEQQMFVASFYGYLNYNSRTEFVVDLDNVWKWIGFTKKVNAKRLLEQFFVIDKDYKLLLLSKEEHHGNTSGGHNKETIMLTINTFKRFCLKAGTKKADQIHEYYLKLEETLHEIVNEESNELRLQLENQLTTAEKEKELLRERTLLEQFPDNIQCIYYGIIDNKSEKNEKLIKFGNSNFLRNRVDTHKRIYENFRLINAFKVENKIQIENALKKHAIINENRRTITINNTKSTELLVRDGFSFEQFDSIIKDIILSVEYSVDNYKKLLKENDRMNKEIQKLNSEIENLNSQKYTVEQIRSDRNIDEENRSLIIKNLLLEEENQKLKKENSKFIKKYKPKSNVLDMTQNNEENDPPTITDGEYTDATSSMKRIARRSDGFYYIGRNKYKECFGSREEVWNGDAYKTTGGLTKADLIINKNGKIVSKRKFIYEKTSNRFGENPLSK